MTKRNYVEKLHKILMTKSSNDKKFEKSKRGKCAKKKSLVKSE